MHRFLIHFLLSVLVACRAATDPGTPEGAYHLFVQGFHSGRYDLVYDRLDSATRASFLTYLDSSRAVIRLIRTSYPPRLRDAALNDLSVPLGDGFFTVEDIENATSNSECFGILCKKMFANHRDAVGFIQQFGTHIESIERANDRTAVVRTVAGDTLVFSQQSDGQYRTSEIFGPSFRALSDLGTRNLAIVRANLDVFSK